MRAKRYLTAALPVRTALLVLLAAPLLCSCAGVKLRTGVNKPGAARASSVAASSADPASAWDEDENGGLKRDWPMGLFILLIGAAAGAM